MLTSGSVGAGTSSAAPSIGASGRAGPLEAIIGCDPCDTRSRQLIRAFRPASIAYIARVNAARARDILLLRPRDRSPDSLFERYLWLVVEQLDRPADVGDVARHLANALGRLNLNAWWHIQRL